MTIAPPLNRYFKTIYKSEDINLQLLEIVENINARNTNLLN